MIIRAVEIKEFDFTEYGFYYNMLDDQHDVMNIKKKMWLGCN